uniref:Uncharacterized protein n=1 Tax=Timema poppense TaxID=170557 RepID=A0A7R9H4C3_TIMPO|nr:unnamed protein product [Timema poppensis]
MMGVNLCGLVVRVPGYRFRGLIPRAFRIFCEPVGLERGQAQLNNEDKVSRLVVLCGRQASVSRRDARTLHPVPLLHNTAPQLHLVGPSRGIPPFDKGVRRGDHLSTALLRCSHPTKTRLFGKITSDSTNLRNNKSRVVGGSVPKCDVSLVTSFKETGIDNIYPKCRSQALIVIPGWGSIEGGFVPGADDTWNFCKIPVKKRKMEFLAKVSPMHRLRPDNTMLSLSAGSELVHQVGSNRSLSTYIPP